ncbi:MAG: ATP-binding protein, partial [Mariprofundaceae bacterium]|nr:ATP-binding protein [Mariprofundaceae bacterium]
HFTLEHQVRDNGEYVMGYLPLYTHRNFVALLRAETRLPDDVMFSARSIETDYRTYRELERHRQGIQDTFMHTLMMVTVLILCFAGFFAVLFARKLTLPIEALAKALKKVEKGELDALVPISANDELGSLATSFNSMTLQLQNNVSALQQTQLDLTDALVSSRQRRYVLETLLLNLQSGVILLGDDGHIRLMNQTCEKLFSLVDNESQKTNIFDFSEAHLTPVLDFYRLLQQEEKGVLQQEFTLSLEQHKVNILARGTLLGAQEDTLFQGWLLVFDDVTQLAEAQKHQAWSEVAQRLAHEIKNPLTPIKLATERLQRRFRSQVDDEEVFDLCTHAVIGQVERLQRLLDDFSNLATLPKPKCQHVSIASLLQELRELYSAYHDLVFEGLPQGEVYCDADQVRQVLINLIDNALATQSMVRVFVEIRDEDTSFYVQDEGSGIDETTLKHMFEPYFSTKKRGSGLGLAIAQRITEEHHGQLLLLSAASPTRFCMRLPHVENVPEEDKL